MKVRVWLNEAPGHYDGYLPSHDPHLHESAIAGWSAPDGSVWTALDLVFAFCNGADPQSELWYHVGNRSLSVGDVVALATDGGWQAFACDRSGWSRLDELPNAPVHSS